MVIGSDLQELVDKGLVNDRRAFDQTSLALHLHSRILTLEPPRGQVVEYGADIPREWCRSNVIGSGGLVLAPHSAVLACSEERIDMPPGYMGLVQTKGSLARLFVSATCCDGQIDTGYEGRVTLEICNLAGFPIKLRALDPVAQVFILKGSTTDVTPYRGRYQGAVTPTLPVSDLLGNPDEFEKLFSSAKEHEGSRVR